MPPQLPFAKELHSTKYRGEGESFREAGNRWAGALQDSPEHFHIIRDIYHDQRFLPAGRVQAAMGSTRSITAYNCFVSGTIEDSFVEGSGSIMDAATQAATTMRMGGGIGYDFSTLRPRGDRIRKLGSTSSGPIKFMEIFNAICRVTASKGDRRGAQMGVMRIDHPDVEEFIHAKQPPKEAEPILDEIAKCEVGSSDWVKWMGVLQEVYRLTGFNVSLAITDEFMEALANERPFPLRWGGKVYREIDPVALWNTIMRSTWDWAEPGALFIDRINEMNNLWYCETIAATNPCGEQPLPPFGACLLGSFNLVQYVVGNSFDWDRYRADIPPIVRAMDNVIDRTTYPLYEQEKEAKNKRRMGLGITGLANAGEALGFLYGSPDFLAFEAKVLDTLNAESYLASAMLAKEKGPFPLYDAEKYLQGKFIKTLPDDVQDAIRKYGIRNSHLTSIAPTGTISMCADNVSSGIEPVFAYEQERLVQMPDGPITTKVPDYGFANFGVRGKRADSVTPDEHLDVLVTAAQRVDSAVSKTCNVSPDTSWEDFKNLYVRAWERGCKGITTFQVGGKRTGVLKSADDDSGVGCKIDPETGVRECE